MLKMREMNFPAEPVLGVDIGGSSIKAAVVDPGTGALLRAVESVPHSVEASPGEIVDAVSRIITHFDWTGPIGCGYPGVVIKGKAFSAAHLSDEWLETDLLDLLRPLTSSRICVLNDADAAGLAEVSFGAGRDVSGTVLLLTLGTGIGSALFRDGVLIPNSEFGHIWMPSGNEAEDIAAASIRIRDNMTWSDWGKNLDEYLVYINKLLSPDLIILGGGVSENFDKFEQFLNLSNKIVPAQLTNQAGLIGAALACSHNLIF